MPPGMGYTIITRLSPIIYVSLLSRHSSQHSSTKVLIGYREAALFMQIPHEAGTKTCYSIPGILSIYMLVILYRIHVPAGNERTDRVWAWEQDLMLSHCCPVVGRDTARNTAPAARPTGRSWQLGAAPEQQQLVSELRETSPFTHHSLHANCMPLV